MAEVTQIVFRGLGLRDQPPQQLLTGITRVQARWFHLLRLFFGLIWLFNAWTASSGASKLAIAHFVGLPAASGAAHLAGNVIVAVNLYIALALFSGRGMRAALWIGIVSLLIMWLGFEYSGGFNPAGGATDAGIAPPYLIALILAYTGWRLSQSAGDAGELSASERTNLLWSHTARLLFGFLWAWDTLFKWHPYFLTHFVGYLSGAESGQPAWIAAYLQGWITIIAFIGPVVFAVIAALVEAAIAFSLLSGRLLRVFLPIGLIYSLMVWTTAEGFGGPYSPGQTGMPGNMFGNAVIYALIFAYLMALYRWPRTPALKKMP